MSKSYFNIREALEIGTNDIVDAYKKATPGQVTEAPEDDMPASPDEASMAMDQAAFIAYVAEEIADYIEGGNEFPEWMQNKLTGLHEKAKDMHAVMAGKYESVQEATGKIDELKKSTLGSYIKKAHQSKSFTAADIGRMGSRGDTSRDEYKKVKDKHKNRSIGIDRAVDRMTKEEVAEAMKFSDKQIKMAYGIANDKRYKGGNYTGAVRAIEKIAKGLSDHPDVKKVLKVTNESVALAEKLTVADGMGEWIKDFQKSDAPQFQGKSEKERREMAIAAYMAAKKEKGKKK